MLQMPSLHLKEASEVNRNIDQGGRLGELNLTTNEIDDLIAFLETLTDE